MVVVPASTFDSLRAQRASLNDIRAKLSTSHLSDLTDAEELRRLILASIDTQLEIVQNIEEALNRKW